MAQTFKHKETGEIIRVARVRYFIEDGKSPQDLSGTYDLTDYEYFDEEPTTSYETVRVTKGRNDGKGLR